MAPKDPMNSNDWMNVHQTGTFAMPAVKRSEPDTDPRRLAITPLRKRIDRVLTGLAAKKLLVATTRQEFEKKMHSECVKCEDARFADAKEAITHDIIIDAKCKHSFCAKSIVEDDVRVQIRDFTKQTVERVNDHIDAELTKTLTAEPTKPKHYSTW